MGVMMLRDMLRSLVFPGLDLHLRNRASLSRYWRTGSRNVLDAGSGNGYFAWLAYVSGASVVAFNFDRQQAEKAGNFLVGYRGADPERLRFEVRNLYDLASETRSFDEIICYEVLEHIRGDRQVVAEFFRMLKQGGALHLCCPNAAHPRHRREVLDEKEAGGHVRAGYTEKDYRNLLEPAGFQIDLVVGIGPHPLYLADEFLRKIRNRFGDLVALPFLPFVLPFVWFARMNPPAPFSIYVRAVKANGKR
jgi:SAM-dependent methyltransferase